MTRWFLLIAALCLPLWMWSASRPAEVPFELRMLDWGASETAAFADFNRDGKLDIVSGESWYEAPSWRAHRFREIEYRAGYVDNFSDLPIDVNRDGHIDLVGCSWFTKQLSWWKNPGTKEGTWQRSTIREGASTEFAFLVDLNNDGRAEELLPQFGDVKTPLTWYSVKDGTFEEHVTSKVSYGHGIGAGDVNRDGRNDVLTPQGWLEAPASAAGEWTLHPDWKLESLGFIHVLDVNGDGRNDVVSSMAHDYGIIWLEQGPDSAWKRRVIDDSWSQPHAMSVADINRDGQLDLVTGKRFMAHNGRDPGEREPLGIYWYEYRKDEAGAISWIRHVVDYGSRAGGGMQIAVADYNGDGALDLATGGKSGLFLFTNLAKQLASKTK